MSRPVTVQTTTCISMPTPTAPYVSTSVPATTVPTSVTTFATSAPATTIPTIVPTTPVPAQTPVPTTTVPVVK